MIMQGIDTFESIFHKVFSGEHKYNICECYTENGWMKESYDSYLHRIYGIAAKLETVLADQPAGSWVGVKAANSPYWAALFWALMMRGYHLVIIDNNGNEAFLNNVAENAGISVMICSDMNTPANVKKVSFAELTAAEPAESCQSDRVFADKIALCTSGTTGTPKIFIHTGKQFGAQINNVLARYQESDSLRFLLEDTKKTMFSMFPFHHISALMSIFIYELLHGTMVTTETLNISNVITAIREAGVQIAYSVPMIWDSVVKYIVGKYQKADAETFRQVLGDQLGFVIMGAAKANPETLALFDSVGIFSSQAYGMTEIGSLTSNTNRFIDMRTNGSVGTVDSDVYEARIYHEDGTITEEGEGELIVAGDIVFAGRLIGGKEVPAELFMGKYFFTGDHVRIENQSLFVLGRNKDVILNSSGENIYPDELEAFFSEIKAYSDSYVVVGISEHPVLAAFVSEQKHADAIMNVLNKKNNDLPVFKRLRAAYFTNQPLPATSSGKIKKNAIREYIMTGNEIFRKAEIKGEI